MKYRPAIKTTRPETLRGIQSGQWIDYDGTRGRFMGVKPSGTIWIAWGRTASRHFARFAREFKHGIGA